MFRFALVPIIFVSVFCGHEAVGAAVTGTAVRLDCLAEMNEVRAAAELAAFGNATTTEQVMPEHTVQGKAKTAEDLWNEICEEIGDSEGTEAHQLRGTFAYYPDSKDCKAAVQYWKDGFSLFKDELPPTYTEPDNPVVYTEKAVSFVALYNPQASPVARCALITCTQGGAFAARRMLKSHEGRSTRRLQGEEDTTTAVICLTNPVALSKGQQPFKEEVWQKIVQALVGAEKSNGASSGRPSLAVGFLIMVFAYILF
ncbi:SAG family member [Eimeria tenella]|uniref:SAG family member n=1 Tax=Eimeria tenella TaxID=5802 RepID=U6KYI6_EIMTE|nr:SAG family member [Eimeria tenella]CDJ41973.1 SAG family member [Eimeria tenella]|eukprot:XP_013232723.1 SAG family member [Eimeria tenella]